MKATLSMVALVALLASGCVPSSVAEQANVTTSAKPTTRLYVRTTPPGAKIRIDGKEKPKMSPQLFDVPPGAKSMTVEVELGGHPGQRKVVVIEGGRIIRVEFKFTKKAQPPAESVAAPQTPRILLYLVVGKDRMTFQGKDTTWDELAKLLEKVPASKNTVLHIARAPGEMTAEHWDQAVGRAIKLIKRFGFGNLSQIGVHPLGSKWEEAWTLPEATAQPPKEPSAGIPKRSIWDHVRNPPEDWRVQRSAVLRPDQMAPIEKKLGSQFKWLSNSVFTAHNQRVQVNVIECWTNEDAEKTHKAVLATKGDPAYALRFDKTIVEFVGTFDVAFAKRAARELGLVPKPDEPKEVSFGPVSEQFLGDPQKAVAELLDLDTGRRATMTEFGRDDRQTHRWIREHRMDALGGGREAGGVGLMLFDVAVWENPSIDWEKITAAEVRDHRALAQTEPDTITTIYEQDLSKLPRTCLFRTREGGLGVLQVVAAEGPRFVKIRYKLVQEPPSGSAAAPPVEGVVLAVAGDGLVEISIGANHGLRRGHRLMVYRRSDPDGRSVYVGGIEAVKTAADTSVCRIDSELAKSPLRKGDRVRRRLRTEDSLPQTQSPSTAEAGSIWDRVMNPPEGWKVQQSFIVPRDQVATIEKKLGGRIKGLSNTVFSAHGQQVQVNVFECAASADAEKIHEAVLATKGDPAYALRFDKTIVEFVGTFDVDSAKRAARELGLIPSPVKAKRVHLPDADTPGARVVLDLASGEMFDVVRERDVPAQFKGLGKGDLFFDRLLGCLRGARALWWDGARFVPLPSADRQGDATAYKLPGLPCRLLITTAEKRRFDVTILAVADDGGIDLEYGPADPAVVPKAARASDPAAATPDSARVDGIMRAYAEAVWAEALPKLDGVEPKEALPVIEKVAAGAYARHLAPHRETLVEHSLGRLPTAGPIDRSQWTGKSMEIPGDLSDDATQASFLLWHPVLAAGAYRQGALAKQSGVEAFGKRAMLQSLAPVGSVALDRDPDRPVIATAMGDELLVVRLRRNGGELYRCDQVEWLKRKRRPASKAAASYAVLRADASPAERLIRAYSQEVWSRLLPVLEAKDVDDIVKEANAIAATYFPARNRKVCAEEAGRILARLPKAEPLDRSRWQPKSSLDAGKAARKLGGTTSGAPSLAALDPVRSARMVRMALLVDQEGPAAIGVRSLIARVAMHPLDTAADPSPDHPVIVNRTGREMTIVRLRRNETGTYDLDGFEWLVRVDREK